MEILQNLFDSVGLQGSYDSYFGFHWILDFVVLLGEYDYHGHLSSLDSEPLGSAGFQGTLVSSGLQVVLGYDNL